MDVYTRKCEFNTATQFYVPSTHFVNIGTEGKTTSEYTWNEVSVDVKKMFDDCTFKYSNTIIFQESIIINDNGLEAMSMSEGVSDFSDVDIGMIKIHSKTQTMFKIKNNKLVVSKTTTNDIAITEL
jgi:hypothetical protein